MRIYKDRKSVHILAVVISLVLVLTMTLLSGCGKTGGTDEEASEGETVHWQDYNGKRIGVLIGLGGRCGRVFSGQRILLLQQLSGLRRRAFC